MKLTIAAPCRKSWAGMSGGDRVRFCRACRQNVYNLSELSEREAWALVRRLEGRVCARFYQRPDGTVLTRDCRETLLRRLTFRVTTTVGLLFLGVVAALVAGESGKREGGFAAWLAELMPVMTFRSQMGSPQDGGLTPWAW
ncbi:MAG TPA: hypothetical protein VF950_22810 [Planctomycetota bacterium]